MTEPQRDELRQRVRDDEQPPAAARVVIRGGPDTLSLLRAHARRLWRSYQLDGQPVYGISVFVALDDIGPASERGILTVKLQSYPSVYCCTVAAVTAAGFELLATFSRPHFTIVLPDLDSVGSLAAMFGELLVNPYAGRGEEQR